VAVFKDSQGREWIVEISVDTVKRVRTVLDLDLLSIADRESDVLEKLLDDPVMLCNVLFVVVQPQAEKLGVGDEDFGRSLFGDVLDDATKAFLMGLADFFPRRRRELLKAALSKVDEVVDRLSDLAAKRLASGELDRELEKVVESALAKFGSSSTSSPASSDATPAP